MTQRRVCHKCGDEILSNFFDDALKGIGKRGSTFADADAVTHDMDGDRFLFQEFKRDGEEIGKGQDLLLRGLSRRDFITVWAVKRMNDGSLKWRDYALQRTEFISVAEYQRRFAGWWACNWPGVLDDAMVEVEVLERATAEAVTAADISW